MLEKEVMQLVTIFKIPKTYFSDYPLALLRIFFVCAWDHMVFKIKKYVS